MSNWKKRGKQASASVGILSALLGVPMDPVKPSKPLTQHRNWSKHSSVDSRSSDLTRGYRTSTQAKGRQSSGSGKKY